MRGPTPKQALRLHQPLTFPRWQGLTLDRDISKEALMQIRIENMTCGGCARGVTRAIQSLDPAAEVVADPPNRRIEVHSTASRAELEAVLKTAGFHPTST